MPHSFKAGDLVKFRDCDNHDSWVGFECETGHVKECAIKENSIALVLEPSIEKWSFCKTNPLIEHMDIRKFVVILYETKKYIVHWEFLKKL